MSKPTHLEASTRSRGRRGRVRHQPGDPRWLAGMGALLAGALCVTVGVVGTSLPAAATGQGTFADPNTIFIVIDESSIDNEAVSAGSQAAYLLADDPSDPGDTHDPNDPATWTAHGWTVADVNDGDISPPASESGPNPARRAILPYFASNVGQSIVIANGSSTDAGWFEVTTVPASWGLAGPTTDGIRNFIGNPALVSAHAWPYNVGPGLGSGGNPEALLDKIPMSDVTDADITAWAPSTVVCAVVKDSDISFDGAKEEGNLQGNYLGVVSFRIDALVTDPPHPLISADPGRGAVRITILDAQTTCTPPVNGTTTTAPTTTTTEGPTTTTTEPTTTTTVATTTTTTAPTTTTSSTVDGSTTSTTVGDTVVTPTTDDSTPTSAATAVFGVQLPRTGAASLPITGAGFVLLALGLASLASSRLLTARRQS